MVRNRGTRYSVMTGTMATQPNAPSVAARALKRLNHNPLPLTTKRATAVQSCIAYLAEYASFYGLSAQDLQGLSRLLPAANQPRNEAASYYFELEKAVTST